MNNLDCGQDDAYPDQYAERDARKHTEQELELLAQASNRFDIIMISDLCEHEMPRHQCTLCLFHDLISRVACKHANKNTCDCIPIDAKKLERGFRSLFKVTR